MLSASDRRDARDHRDREQQSHLRLHLSPSSEPASRARRARSPR
jgi:hypothetical protein